MKVLLVDNLGFTASLIDEFKKKDCEVISYRNDVDFKIFENAVSKFKPSLIVLSSGPGAVKDAGISVDVIMHYCGKIPIFGVGLGHLCIIEAFEGKVNRNNIHSGKIIKVTHDDKTIFKKLQSPFDAGSYNSYSGSEIPLSLEVSARSENDIVMGVRHKEYFVEGVQFNPESLLTVDGSLIISSVLKEVGKK